MARVERIAADLSDRHDINVEVRALAVRTLLHLPRVADAHGLIGDDDLDAEIRRLAVRLNADAHRVLHLIPSVRRHSLDQLVFAEVPTDVAEPIFQSLHYLGYARPDSVNYGLIEPGGLPVALCSVSPMEWHRVADHLRWRFGVQRDRILDLSRVVALHGAPENSISKMLSGLRRTLRASGAPVDLLTSVVDPNLGFTGVSYRAANWQHWFSVRPRPYLYYNGEYRTPRWLIAHLRTPNAYTFRPEAPAVLTRSRAALLDSMIFCHRLRRRTEDVPNELRERLQR